MVRRLKTTLKQSETPIQAVLNGVSNIPAIRVTATVPITKVMKKVIKKAITTAQRTVTTKPTTAAYQEGYEEGYRAGLSDDPSAPDNDIIDRSEVAGTSSYPQKTEKKSWINSDNVGLLAFPLVGVIALFLWLLDKLIQKKG